MPADVSRSTGEKVRSAFYGVIESGILIGGTATAPAAGDQDGSPMLQLEAVKSWPLLPAAPDTPQQDGDGGPYARFISKPTELPTAGATFGANDKAFQALVTSMVERNIGGGQFVMRGANCPTYPTMAFVVQGPAQSKDAGSLDEGMWEGTIFLNTQIDPQGRNDYNTGSVPDYLYTLVSNKASQHLWGEAFTVVLDGDTKTTMVDYTWPYQLHFARYTLDAIETEFNLPKQLAEDSADNIIVYVNGVELDWIASTPTASDFEADVTANTITLGDAGTSSDVLIVGYGFSGC